MKATIKGLITGTIFLCNRCYFFDKKKNLTVPSDLMIFANQKYRYFISCIVNWVKFFNQSVV